MSVDEEAVEANRERGIGAGANPFGFDDCYMSDDEWRKLIGGAEDGSAL